MVGGNVLSLTTLFLDNENDRYKIIYLGPSGAWEIGLVWRAPYRVFQCLFGICTKNEKKNDRLVFYTGELFCLFDFNLQTF